MQSVVLWRYCGRYFNPVSRDGKYLKIFLLVIAKYLINKINNNNGWIVWKFKSIWNLLEQYTFNQQNIAGSLIVAFTIKFTYKKVTYDYLKIDLYQQHRYKELYTNQLLKSHIYCKLACYICCK